MNQFQWTFLDNKQQRHTLGIAHSPTSGHLVVHCDHRVTLIEFSVLEDKEFSFFVEDELCRLKVMGNVEDGFTYNFEIDEEVDTEVNRVRNADRKRTTRQNLVRSVLLFLAPVVILGSLFAWGYSSYLSKLPEELLTRGVRAQATLLADGEFEFIGENQVVKGEPLGKDRKRLQALSAPAESFVPVLFVKGDPDHFIVDWRRVLQPLPRDSAQSTGFAKALTALLASQLPAAAGRPKCALQTARKIAGRRAPLGIIDAYVLNDVDQQALWRNRFKDPAYQARLSKICPPATVLPSAPAQ